jgi:hypothetical protein
MRYEHSSQVIFATNDGVRQMLPASARQVGMGWGGERCCGGGGRDVKTCGLVVGEGHRDIAAGVLRRLMFKRLPEFSFNCSAPFSQNLKSEPFRTQDNILFFIFIPVIGHLDMDLL